MFDALKRVVTAVFGSEPLVAVNAIVLVGYAIYQAVQTELDGQTGAVAVAVAVATVLARRLVSPATD